MCKDKPMNHLSITEEMKNEMLNSKCVGTMFSIILDKYSRNNWISNISTDIEVPINHWQIYEEYPIQLPCAIIFVSMGGKVTYNDNNYSSQNINRLVDILKKYIDELVVGIGKVQA